MKTKLSVTIDESKLGNLDALVRTGSFRNRSHIVEYAIDMLMKYEVNEHENKDTRQ